MSEAGTDHAAELRRMSRKCIPSRGPWGDIPATMVQAATYIDELRESLAAMTRERDEDQGVIAVWRGRTQRAEDERDALRAEVERLRGALSDEKLLGAIARGWCSPENSSKEMDAALAFAIAESIQKSALTPAEVPRCCGRYEVGADYMGAQELVCCGNYEPAEEAKT
jgi:hypothetical protein